MRAADERVMVLARRQHYVMSRAQLLRTGLTPDDISYRLETGRLTLVYPNVYLVVPGVLGFEGRTLAAVLATGPTALASHRCAAALWGLRGFEAGIIEVSYPYDGRRRRLTAVAIHSTRSLERVDRANRFGIPITSPARALFDLASVVPSVVLEPAMEDAVLRRLVRVTSLERAAARLPAPGRHGSAAFRQLLDDHDPARAPTETELEDSLVAIIRAHGLPEPVRQHWLNGPAGQRHRVDLAYPELRLALEADSRTWHSITRDRDRDAAKANCMVALRWWTLHFTTTQIRHDPSYVATTIALQLQRQAGEAGAESQS